MKFRWDDLELALVMRGSLVGLLVVLMFLAIRLHAQTVPPSPVQVVQGQPTNIYVPGSPSFFTSTTTDPWFWSLIVMWVFSAIVSGMPEPRPSSGDGYVWIYRSLHILMAMGTSYFSHRAMWLNPERMADAVDHFDKPEQKGT